MTIFRFTVNVPNPTDKAAAVRLRLERARADDLKRLPGGDSKAELKVTGAGIALDRCAARGKTRPAVNLKLMPYSSNDVYIIVDADTSGEPGVAAFHLVDRREGRDVGGVLLTCSHPPLSERPGEFIYPEKPCLAAFARKPYLIAPGENPGKRPGSGISISMRDLELVAPITNPGTGSLKNTRVYLEHLGTSSVQFTPGLWNAGTLARGDIFYATWPVRFVAGPVADFTACVVVASKGTDPVRLYERIKIVQRH